MRPPEPGGLSAGERYARLRLEQMVRAGFLKGMPAPAPIGGYSALWRSVSQGLNQRAQARGFTGALQALRNLPPDAQHQQAYYDPVSAARVGAASVAGHVAAKPPDYAAAAAAAAHKAAQRKAKRTFAQMAAGLGLPY